MTQERDFDRIARAWLDLGPNEAPDRAVSAVLQAVAQTPQVRRPVRWPTWRLFDMTRLPIVAGAAAVVAAVVGGMLLMNRPSDPAIGVPSAVPSAVPSESAAAGTIPAALRYRWIGEPRDVPPLGERTRHAMDLSTGSYYYTATDVSAWIRSNAAVPTDGVLRLESAEAPTPCETGNVGTYRYTLSPGGTRLSVAVEGVDDCAVRTAAVTGDWFRVACKTVDGGCWGDLETGTYPTQYIRPRLDQGEAWAPLLGDASFTVPEGWANAEDWPTKLRLTPAADYALETGDGPPDGVINNLELYAHPSAVRQDESCSLARDGTIERSPEALVEWIAGLPGIDATEPQDITVDGYAGRWIDIGVAPDWTKSCPFVTDGSPSVPLLADGESWDLGVIGVERMRLVFVDLGDGDTVVFVVDSSDPARFDELAAASMPIIESFTFRE